MVRHGKMEASLVDTSLRATLAGLRRHLTVVPEAGYRQQEAAALARISRDPNDWLTLAVALALDAGIWTNDHDFFGCGASAWITETLLPHLEAR